MYYQGDGIANVWRKRGSAHDTEQTSSSVKLGGGGVMATSGRGSLVCMDDVTHGGSSRMNSQVCRNIFSANLQRNASKLHHAARQWPKTLWQHNKGLHQGEKWKELKEAAAKGWKSITNSAVIQSEDYSAKYPMLYTWRLFVLLILQIKKWGSLIQNGVCTKMPGNKSWNSVSF